MLKIMKLRGAAALVAFILLFNLTACGDADNTTGQNGTSGAQPQGPQVNGFGTAGNHVHSLLSMNGNLLLLASHYGLFRSENNGKDWKKVAAGPNQIMDGLMTYSLNSSSLNPKRLYVLSQPVTSNQPGTPGLYTSEDQGITWKLSSAQSSLSSRPIYLETPGNQKETQVYVYLVGQGASGLRMSMDAGKTFSPTAQLPFGNLLGLLALPGTPGELLAYGNDGVAHSSDGGKSWQKISLQDSIYEMVTAGHGDPIYATGDQGIYVSKDGGKSFTSTGTQTSYTGLVVGASQPEQIYGKTGTGIYRSKDGGKSWNALPQIKGNLGNLAVDPQQRDRVYLSISYPTEIYTQQGSDQWQSLTPRS